MRDDDATPDAQAPAPAEAPSAEFGRLAHEMNNAVAYVVTNLNLLTEEIEQVTDDPTTQQRLLRFLDDANSGAAKVSDLVRRMKVLSWGDGFEESVEDDTWDEAGPKRVLVIDDEPNILVSVTAPSSATTWWWPSRGSAPSSCCRAARASTSCCATS